MSVLMIVIFAFWRVSLQIYEVFGFNEIFMGINHIKARHFSVTEQTYTIIWGAENTYSQWTVARLRINVNTSGDNLKLLLSNKNIRNH